MLAESDTDREALIRLLLPYVLCCFRVRVRFYLCFRVGSHRRLQYNCFHAADIHYSLPLHHAEVPILP